MIELKAVIEVTRGYLELSGRMTREQVKTALVAIGDYGSDEDVSAQAALRALLDQEMIVMAGGLRVRDTATGVQVEPGCCFGLEEWRSWQDLVRGGEPWLGHGPAPGLEHGDGVVRLRQDAGQRDGPACEIVLADLPGHLEGVRRDLLGFLELVRGWAPHGLGEQLADAFDEHFRISAPL